jgi:hypothetical protein
MQQQVFSHTGNYFSGFAQSNQHCPGFNHSFGGRSIGLIYVHKKFLSIC